MLGSVKSAMHHESNKTATMSNQTSKLQFTGKLFTTKQPQTKKSVLL